MTAETLKSCNKKTLAQMAKDQGITGWHAMRKDQLIRALSLDGLPTSGADLPPPSSLAGAVVVGTKKPAGAAPPIAPPRPLPTPPNRTLDHGCEKDRVVVVVRDPYWLHAYWELSRSTLERAKAAMGQEWHSAKPILRVYDVTSEDTTANAERFLRDIPIHGEVNNWYIDVNNPPRSYRVDIGYLSARGRFFVLAKSNVVTTPKARIADIASGNGSSKMSLDLPAGLENEQDARVAAQIRDLLLKSQQRPMNGFSMNTLGTGAFPSFGRDFHFTLDAELVVYGVTEPNSKVTLQGEPVTLRPDGTFTVRFSLPDSRVIIPAVASSPDGVEERTIVLAVERNTKQLEPQIHDGNEL
jgi:hypothetical protein